LAPKETDWPNQPRKVEAPAGFRDECLNQNWFMDLRHARELIEALAGGLQHRAAARLAEISDAGTVRRATSAKS